MLNLELHPNHRRFADTFARLWFEQHKSGIENPRVGRMAALMAGYGAGSWCENNAIQTADVMFNKLIKRSDVQQYLRELGLERVGRKWQPVQQAESA